MAKKTGGRASKKVKDKWKAKQWYPILAPDMFQNQRIGETTADDPEKLVGRIIETSLQDVTGDFSKIHIKPRFRITGLRGEECATQFIGHVLSSDYIRRLTRRKHSKMDGVYTIVTQDGYRFTIKPMAITEKRIQASQQREIRKHAGEVMLEVAKTKTLAGAVELIFNGELSKMIFRKCKPIYPLKKVEIRKSQVIGRVPGSQDIPLTSIAAAEAAAQAAATATVEPVAAAPAVPPVVEESEELPPAAPRSP